MSKLLTLPISRVTDANVNPLSGALLYAYLTGTTTPTPTYTTSALSVQHTNPIVADANGLLPAIYLDPLVTYRFKAKTAAGVDISGMDWDPVTVLASGDIQFTPAGSGAVTRTVQTKLREQPITPEDFGAAGNGVADDTAELTLFAAALGNGVHGRMDGDYKISGAINFSEQSYFELHGTGTVTIANGTATSELFAAFIFTNCENFLVDGIAVDGNRANRTPAEASGHLIRIIGCHGAHFRNCRADNGTTDGWFIAAAATGNGAGGGPLESELPSNIILEDCRASGNWRNGLSLIDGYRITIRGGEYSNTTGSWDADNGPGSGIDIEPDEVPAWIQNRVRDVLIEGALFDSNQGWGLQVTKKDGVHNVVCKDCVFRNSQRGAIEISAAGTRIINPYFNGFTDTDYTAKVGAPDKRGLIDLPSGGDGQAIIESPVFRGITATSSALALFYSHADNAGGNRVLNPDVKDVAITFMLARADRDRCESGFVVNSAGIDGTGDDFLALNISFFDCPGIHVRTQGARAVIRGCEAIEPTDNTSAGVFNLTVADGIIEFCEIYRAASAAGHGIVAGAAPRRVVGNTVTGFTGNAYAITGTPLVIRDNIENGAKKTGETAIS